MDQEEISRGIRKMLYVVTEKGHNFYWNGEDLPSGTEFEARTWEVKGPENMGIVMRKEHYILLKENQEKLLLEQRKELFKNLNNPILTGTELLNMPYNPKEWLYEGVIPKRGITIIGGDPKSFKSYFALYLSCCMVQGLSLFDKKSQKGTILYLDEENGTETIRQRLEKIKLGGLIDKQIPNFYLSVFNNFKLDSDIKFSMVRTLIEEINPDLVVIDSLVRFYEGDENSANDARRCFENLKNIMEDKGTSFLILHHNKKNSDGRNNNLRGSGDFTAFADVIMQLSKSKDYFVMSQTENRHIENIPAFSFKINNLENEGLVLDFCGDLEENQSKKDRATEIIMSFLQNDATEVVMAKSIKEATRGDNITDKTAERVIKDLVTLGRLERAGYGKYKVNRDKKLNIEYDTMRQ